MMGLVKYPSWLGVDWVLSQCAKRRTDARRRYADFVAQGWGQPAVRGQVLLGSDTFVEKMRLLLEGKQELKEIPRAQRLLHRPDLGTLFTSATLSDKLARNQAIRKVYRAYGYSMASIAQSYWAALFHREQDY